MGSGARCWGFWLDEGWIVATPMEPHGDVGLVGCLSSATGVLCLVPCVSGWSWGFQAPLAGGRRAVASYDPRTEPRIGAWLLLWLSTWSHFLPS